MEDRAMIECAAPADRDALAVILVRNGYTVRVVKKKSPTGSRTISYVEYWKGGSAGELH